ncbi:MAG: hypothetical protein CFE41_09625 [Burkholderiales bacterium PBB2]|nr:MAG: hypothetical protein CFE41_09625 [Burkholderiales bacterium PBB2]
MPTLSPKPRATERAARRPGWSWCRTLSLCLSLLSAPLLQAHELGLKALPEQTGLRLGAALALSQARADTAWPMAKLPGILGNGETPVDRRDGALEHATVDAGLRLGEHVGALLALGWHDSDPVHVEAAWLQAEARRGDEQWLLGAGRNRLPQGRLIDGGGHFDRFASQPLAKRAVLGGDWIDDGISLRWQRSHEGRWAALETVDLGLWRARRFPGGSQGPAAAAAHARLAWGDVALDASAALLRPRGRGAYVQSSTAAHTHERPDCSGNLLGIHCFDGRSQVFSASLSWLLPTEADLRLEAAGLLRRDRGQLYSINGDTDYQGSTGGGWLDLIWQIRPSTGLALRAETLRGVQTLESVNALAVARDAGLLGNSRIWRAAASLSHEPWPGLRLSLEAGRETLGSQHNNFSLLRLVWTPDALWSRSW